jgi:hypothetical protein
MTDPESEPIDPESGQLWRVAFSCDDCQRSMVRLTHVDPLSLRRCWECEWRRTERISDEILDLVFGPRSAG